VPDIFDKAEEIANQRAGRGGANGDIFDRAEAIAQRRRAGGRGTRGDDDLNNLERAIAGFLEDKPTVQSILGALGAPGSAVSNVLQGDFAGAGENLLDLGRAVSPFHEQTFEDRTSFKDVLTNMGVGKLGEADLPLIGKVSGKGALGLVGDIATDPLRFTGVTRLTGKGANLAKKGKLSTTRIPTPDELAAGVKPLSRLGAQAAAGERALIGVRVPFTTGFVPLLKGERTLNFLGKTIDKVRGSQLGKKFSTVGRIPEIGGNVREAGLTGRALAMGPLENAYWSVRGLMEKEIRAAGGDFDTWKSNLIDIAEKRKGSKDFVPQLDNQTAKMADARIRKVSDQFNKRLSEADQITPDEMQRAFSFISDNPHLLEDPNGIYTAIMATRTNRIMDDILRLETEIGVDPKVLDDAMLNYYYRIITPEARKALSDRALAQQFRDHAKRVFQSSKAARKDAWKGKARGEINAWWRKQGFDFDLFETDPDIVVGARIGKAGRHAQTASSVRRSLEIFGREGSEAMVDENWVKGETIAKAVGVPEMDLGGTAGRMVPLSVARELQNVLRITHDAATPGQLLNLVDTSMSMFKSAVTSVFPQFHARNFVSNVWANFLGGVKSPKVYGISSKILRDLLRIGKEGGDGTTWTIAGRKMTTRELAGEMGRHRALGFGAFSEAELGKVLTRVKGEGAALRGIKAPFRVGRKFGENVENHAKIAHYIDKLQKGFSPEEAASSVKKYLFDYCVDEDTQILTQRGWLRYDELTLKDNCLSIDPNTREIRWSAIQKINVFRARPRTMHRWKHTRIDALTTPAHRWMAEGSGRQGGHWTLRTGVQSHFVTSGEVADGPDKRLVLGGGTPTGPEKAIYSDDFGRLIGWVVTEGSCLKPGKGVVVAQSMKHNPQYVEELRGIASVIRETGATTSEYVREVGWGDIHTFYFGKGINRRIREVAPDKAITPDFVCDLTVNQRRILLDTLMKGDGTVSKKGTRIWAQQDRGRTDGFQMLAAMQGIRSNARDRENITNTTLYKAKHLYTDSLKPELVEYEGRVWCPTTATGTWMARRNGVTYWTGNSDLTDFEKNVMKRVVPFYTFARKNVPLQLESMIQHPGRVSIAAHVQRALQARSEDDAPVNTKFVPEWMRRRIFGIKEGDDGELATISGVGIGLEELALFDQPFSELLAMLRPEIKGALQAGTDRDIFRDIPLSQSDNAFSSFRHLKHIPGGSAFLDWLDFRAVDESKGRYRANPKKLNFIMSLPVAGSTSRALNMASNIDRATAPGAKPSQLPETVLRFLTGIREENLDPVEQSRRNMWRLLKAREAFLREQVLEGAAKEIPIFIPRKELGADDPRTRAVKEATKEIRQILNALRELKVDPTTASTLTETTFRTGGR